MSTKTSKANPWANAMKYPNPVATRNGHKVSWNYYRTKDEAEECAKAAYHNSFIAESEGYDFGYCSPGSIRLMMPENSKEYAGLYEVCLP